MFPTRYIVAAFYAGAYPIFMGDGALLGCVLFFISAVLGDFLPGSIHRTRYVISHMERELLSEIWEPVLQILV